MRILAAGPASSTVILEGNELLAVNNALNEVCNALDIPEFETRMGVSRAEALALLTEIGGLIRRMESPAES
jgi:hypothetical protein